MVMTAKITNTNREDWRQQCHRWAGSGASFEVQGIGAGQLAFCKEVCDTYDYECIYQSNDQNLAAVFKPCSVGP
jgi:hypothetical protein